MKTNPLTNYVKWFINQTHELQKVTPQNSIYKIAGKEKCEKTGEEQFVIQVDGKNAFLKLSPNELMRDEAMLRGFTPLDVRTITYLACHIEKPIKENKSLYRIIAQFFSKNRNEEMFTIQTENNIVRIVKSAQEISSDPALINKFDPEDAHRIGYVTGTEQTVSDNEFFIHKQNENKKANR
jgi:hypothetical protein